MCVERSALHITMNLSAGGTMKDPEKMHSLVQVRELLYQMHPQFRGEDPFYPKGLNREGLDSRVVPAYLTDRNGLQEAFLEKGTSWRRGITEDPQG